MSKRANPTLVGAFVLGAVALAVAGVIVLGSGQFFRNTYSFVSLFTGDVNGLSVGAPVKFKGVDIGTVTRIGITFEPQAKDFRIPVYFEIDADKVRGAGARAPFTREGLRNAIAGGLRAQLNTQSLVTGLLFIQLDFHTDAPPEIAKIDDDIPEIPTMPTTLEKAQSEFKQLMTKLESIDFKALIDNFAAAANGVKELTTSPEIKAALTSLDQTLVSVRQLSDGLRGDLRPVTQGFSETTVTAQKTLVQFEETAKQARGLLAPDSPLAYQLGKTLDEVSSAARSVRLLADYLERNPSAIVRGRTAGGGNQ